MSFKSKQRAKHGHLFGDDPLNAVLVSASDDPLFSPSKTSQSTRTNTTVTADPLSRNSRPTSPLDVSSSTPVSPRRTSKTTASSIFGDIDVSKLGSNSNSNSKRVSTTSLRSTSTLRSSKQFEEDEEDLFGGGRVSRTRVLSKTTSPTPSSTSSIRSSPTLPEPAQPIPSPRKATPSPPPTIQAPPTSQTPPVIQSPPVIQAPIGEEKFNAATQENEDRPSSSFFASASRFFKSSSNTNSKTSSSASSIASVNNGTSPKLKHAEAPLPPVPQVPEPLRPQPSPQQKTQKPQSQRKIPIQQIRENDEEEEEQVSHHHMIEDEATRAFADDVISFQSTYQPDYAAPDLSLLASMDSLRLDGPNKRLLPSASTPTTLRADMDDPWFDGATVNRVLPILGNIEPSASSPLQDQHKISIHDIEPQKRTAFADLITSWNTGQTNTFETVKEDPEQFFSHVAEEQRDIGFAGIGDDDDSIKNISVIDVWDSNEENPWN